MAAVLIFVIMGIVYICMLGAKDKEARKAGKVGLKAFLIAFAFLILFVILLIAITPDTHSKNEWEYTYYQKETKEKDSIDYIKDSIDYIIKERNAIEFNGNIYATLKFGDNRNKVEQILRDKNNRRIIVNNNDTIITININDYDVIYHKDKLACLILYSNQSELLSELNALYTTKYGKTKIGNWEFANCEINISTPIRERYDPQVEAGYKSAPPYLYYDSFRGDKTERITKDMSFIRIMYKDYNLLKKIEKDYEKNITNGIDGLSQLKKYGIISEEEFITHKKRLIEYRNN